MRQVNVGIAGLAGNGQPFYTGFAISNLSASPADLICAAQSERRDDSGRGPRSRAQLIRALGQLPVPGAHGHARNHRLRLQHSVAATALRFIGNNAFSSLPVITK
ncbi:MAG: hypothetical protein ABSB67_19495 [Bryobacteraceae bacterium]|jgi:hypothetical protein